MAYEYKVLGQTVRLEVDPTVVAVRFHGAQPKSLRARAIEAAGAGPFTTRFEIPGEELTIVPVGAAGGQPNSSFRAQSDSVLRSLSAQPEVSHALPVFRVAGNQVVATNRVIVGIDDPAQAASFVGKHGLKPLRSRDDKIVYQIPDGADVFAVAEALTHEPGVRFAEPDFVTIGRHIPSRIGVEAPPILNDPLIKDQYAMRITRAVDAWNIQSGDPRVKIAILDEGVDTRHPDLAAAIIATFDATDDDSFQDPNAWDGHGTCCAGLAVAIANNAVGVRGVGAGCSILAVRIAYSQFQGGPWVTSNEKIARAISWSWQNGADVLSNSWGGGAPSNDIAEEFERARQRGRGGRGCVIVIAAGNQFGPVSFPGTLQSVLTVSASNEYDEAKTPTSKDGENWWGTNHGAEIGIAAPGVHNLTTDISGPGGYVGGDYDPKFNGTSSATPIVAGACGLVLSANANLRESEVRSIIQGTADKVGPYPYVGGRNDFFGNGRLNVLSAVQAVRGTSPGVPAV
jgi:subtilisin family serine protease